MKLASPAPSRQPLAVVLDTNILLDLLVFRDPGVAAIAQHLARGRAICLTNPACLAELRLVIARPMFGLDPSSCQTVMAEYCRIAVVVESPPAMAVAALPRCRDPDDQKFLELARDGAADFLVTKDKALLKLRRISRDPGGFRIVTPAALTTWLLEVADEGHSKSAATDTQVSR